MSRSQNTITFRTTYQLLLLFAWLGFVLHLATYGDTKGFYLFAFFGSFPLSYPVSLLYNLPLPIILSLFVLMGIVQWGLIVGPLLDRFLPQPSLTVSKNFMIVSLRFLFLLGIVSFLISLATISRAFASTIAFNIGLGLTISSIGLKILFFSDKH